MGEPAYRPSPDALGLRLTGDRLAVCRLPVTAAWPAWTAGAPGFLSISLAADEMSVVCSAAVVPPGVTHEKPFRLLHVIGPLPFDQVGIIAGLSSVLAAAGMSILPIATFDTDYLLVREKDVARAVQALCDAGHAVEVVETLAGPPAAVPALDMPVGTGGARLDTDEPRATPERPARRESERVDRLKDDFLGTLSHELRTPLNAILGWTQVLRRLSNLGGSAAGLEAIERNARALSHVVDDLLDLSRLASGDLRLAIEPVDVGAVLHAAIESLGVVANARGVSVTCELTEPLPALVGDAARLQQVAWNLLSNAIKFTPSGGRVTIRADVDQGHVRVVVDDTGRGIAPEYLPEVFERFSQADSSASRLHGGLGLGLSIVRHLVELHGGTVGAESVGLGRGSRFTVRLPVRTHADGAS